MVGMETIYLVISNTGAHDPAGVVSAWNDESEARADADRLNALRLNGERFSVITIALNIPALLTTNSGRNGEAIREVFVVN